MRPCRPITLPFVVRHAQRQVNRRPALLDIDLDRFGVVDQIARQIFDQPFQALGGRFLVDERFGLFRRRFVFVCEFVVIVHASAPRPAAAPAGCGERRSASAAASPLMRDRLGRGPRGVKRS